MPSVDHRYCVRHMYANFKEKHKGRALKDEMWKAASAYTVQDFEKHMEIIKKMDEDVHTWLRAVHPTLWSRAHFSPRSKTDLLCNKISESWNKYILEAREKPIITMLEMIRRQIMKRFEAKKHNINKWRGKLCPKIQDKLDEIKHNARHCELTYGGGIRYEVDYKGNTYVVDLEVRTCLCREWDVTGIPCCHAVAAIFQHNMMPEDFVDPCYFKETYARSYAPMIHHQPGMSMWPHSGCDPVRPPTFRRPPGRPKKARKKAIDEPENLYKVRKHNQSLKCSKCQQVGHNIRTCKGAPVRAPKVGRGGRGGRGVMDGGRGDSVTLGRGSQGSRGGSLGRGSGGRNGGGLGRGGMGTMDGGSGGTVGLGRGGMCTMDGGRGGRGPIGGIQFL